MARHTLSSKITYECGCSYCHSHSTYFDIRAELERVNKREEEHQRINGELRKELNQVFAELGEVEMKLHQLKELHNDNRRSVPSV